MSDADVTFRIDFPMKAGKDALVKAQVAYARGAFMGMQTAKVRIVGRIKESFGKPGRLGWISRRLSRSIGGVLSAFRQGLRLEVGSRGDVPYARIHEYGGTINHPGGTAYILAKDQSGAFGGKRMIFISNVKAADRDYPRTRPHLITMPARPYIRPGVEEELETIEDTLGKSIQRSLDGEA